MSDDRSVPLPSPASTGDPISIVQRVDDALPTGWRLKMAKAAAQLFAGTEAGSRVYGEIRERLDTIEGRSAVSKALAGAVAQQAIDDPATMERAKARFLGSILQKQENLEAVVAGASERVGQLPSPPSGINGQDSGCSEVDKEQRDTENQPLEPDWAATFSGIAENATSEELRDRLSRILAGELTSPGTYSRAVIRQVAELDKSDLEAFREVLPYILKSEILSTHSREEPSVVTLAPLVDAGLIMDSTYTLSQNWPAASEDDAAMLLSGAAHALVFNMKVGQALSFQLVRLTRAGSAVADLLGRADETKVLRRLANLIPAESYNRVRMGVVAPGGARDLIQILPPLPTISISGLAGGNPFGAPPLAS